jgi:hypothetical protein
MGTQLHTPSDVGRHTSKVGIECGGPYYDSRISAPPHHTEEDTETFSETFPPTRCHGPPHLQGPRGCQRKGGPGASTSKGMKKLGHFLFSPWRQYWFVGEFSPKSILFSSLSP